MKRLRIVGALWCLAAAGGAQQQALAQNTAPPAAGKQQLDPFTAPAAAPAAPAPLAPTQTAPAAAPAPPPASGGNPALPPGLRAILIRNNGQGLLGSADANGLSIAVAHGKPVRIGTQDFLAEVSATAIRLYAGPRGRLVWEGSLGSPAPISPPLDMSQLKFVPPLSAGVSPGLKAGQGRGSGGESAPGRAAGGSE